MQQEEKRFTAYLVDEQFEQLTQTAPSVSDTLNSRVVNSLRTLYNENLQQEQQSIERMRQRLALSVTTRQEEKQETTDKHMAAVHEVVNVPKKSVPVSPTRLRLPWFRGLEQCMAALMLLAVIAGWFALSHLPHSSSGSSIVFNDASAQPLSEPISTIKANFSGVTGWSPDGHTLVLLQVDTQKRELNVHMIDIASKHSTIYPVLDPSWMPALDVFNPFQILMGRYLLAVRAKGENQATLEIWDITEQHAVSIQTIPALIASNGQVELPQIASSKNEQKLAVLSPDGTITIWNVANGQKLLTCEGKVSFREHLFPSLIRWYNNDQSLLFSRNDTDSITAWNTATGMSLFNLTDANKASSMPLASPDNKYLALSVGPRPPAGTSFHANILEILDAHSGQVLHKYNINAPSDIAVSTTWLSDSMRMLLTYMPDNNVGTSPSLQTQVYTWNVSTGQKTFVVSFSQTISRGTTPDGQYLILSNNNGRSMEIWQTNSGHKVATVTTPGTYARTDSFFYTNNQQMIIGQKGNFDIWDITTGKLLYKYHGSTPFSIDGVNGSFVFWSPDEKYLVMMAGKSISIGDGMVSIWRIL